MSTEWLSLIEYRNKYNVSVSTLRRRIRDDAIKYQLVRGKYFVFDEAIEVEKPVNPILEPQIKEEIIEAKMPEPATNSSGEITSELFTELKSAYQKILKEKEEHIFLLREEITNLQTLVQVLEEENERLSDVIEADRPEGASVKRPL